MKVVAGAAIACAALTTYGAVTPMTIYDSFSTMENNPPVTRFDTSQGIEIGSQMLFPYYSPSDGVTNSYRQIQSFTFQYYAYSDDGSGVLNPIDNNIFEGTSALQIRLRFYNNNGPLSSGYGSPGNSSTDITPFYDSQFINVYPNYDTGPGGGGEHGSTTMTFSVSTGDFPDGLNLSDQTMTWTIQFQDSGTSDRYGIMMAHVNPDPGISLSEYPVDAWQNDGTGFQLVQYDVVDKTLVLAAEVVAVPEPATVWILALGGLLGLSATRRFTRKS